MSHDSIDSTGGEENSQSRRKVLGGALGVAGTLAIPETAAAASSNNGRSQLKDRYADVAAVRSALEEQTASIRENLVKEGFLDDTALAKFDGSFDDSSFAIVGEGVAAKSTFDAQRREVVTQLAARTESGPYQITLVVEPDTETTFANVLNTKTEELHHVTATQAFGLVKDEDCSNCQKNCDFMYPIKGYLPDSSYSCGDSMGYECWREATCDECSDQDKCDDGGW